MYSSQINLIIKNNQYLTYISLHAQGSHLESTLQTHSSSNKTSRMHKEDIVQSWKLFELLLVFDSSPAFFQRQSQFEGSFFFRNPLNSPLLPWLFRKNHIQNFPHSLVFFFDVHDRSLPRDILLKNHHSAWRVCFFSFIIGFPYDLFGLHRSAESYIKYRKACLTSDSNSSSTINIAFLKSFISSAPSSHHIGLSLATLAQRVVGTDATSFSWTF